MNDDTIDPDGFNLVALLRENADLRTQLVDLTAEADYLRVQLERRLAAEIQTEPAAVEGSG